MNATAAVRNIVRILAVTATATVVGVTGLATAQADTGARTIKPGQNLLGGCAIPEGCAATTSSPIAVTGENNGFDRPEQRAGASSPRAVTGENNGFDRPEGRDQQGSAQIPAIRTSAKDQNNTVEHTPLISVEKVQRAVPPGPRTHPVAKIIHTRDLGAFLDRKHNGIDDSSSRLDKKHQNNPVE